jgi:hypothetical protein
MRSSPQIRLFLGLALGAAGCAGPPEEGSEGAPRERAETTESRASAEPVRFVPAAAMSPSCSYCLQACRVSLRSCRYVVDSNFTGGGYLRCEIDRGGCANRCRTVCR